MRTGAGASGPDDPPALVERGPLLLELSGWFSEATAGRGRVVFVGGEAGAGKTSLIGRFTALVAPGADCLVGWCDPASAAAPLGPLLDVVSRLPGAPVRTGSGRDTLGRDVLAAFGSTHRPLVLVFEDLHWADQATLELVGFLARRFDGHRAMLLATYRDDETIDGHPLRRLLGELATAPAVRRLAVPPLSAEGVRALAAGTGLDPGALLRATGGNPFFVTELIAARDVRATASVRDAVLELALQKRHPWFAGALCERLARAGGPVAAPEWIAAPHRHALAGRWPDAAAEWDARGCAYEAAAVRAASGEPDALRAALATFETLGARPAADRAKRRLRALGVRGLPRGPRASTRGRPGGLTDREMDVLRCVALGLRDSEVAARLGLSTKTVGHHVSSVLSKLGARSRTAAAAHARRLDLLPDGDPRDAPV